MPQPSETPVAGADGSPIVSQIRPKKPVGCGDVPFVSPDHQRRIISKCDSLAFTPPTPSTTAIGRCEMRARFGCHPRLFVIGNTWLAGTETVGRCV